MLGGGGQALPRLSPVRMLRLTLKRFLLFLPLFRLKVKKPRSVCLSPCSASVGTPSRLCGRSSSPIRWDRQLGRQLLLCAEVLGLRVSFPGGIPVVQVH